MKGKNELHDDFLDIKLIMADFQTRLVKHLSSELNCKSTDVTKALNTFTTPTKVQKKTPVVEKHTCERVPRGHDEPCGKRAKNEIELTDGTKHWFCGTLKSGCSKSVWNTIEKEKQNKAAESIFKETIVAKKSTNTGKDRKKKADKKTESFLKKKKIVRENKLQCKKIKTKTNGAVYMDFTTRILFDQNTKEAYGILGKDNDTILPLGKREKDWIELHNFSFKQKFKEKVDSEGHSESDSEGHSEDDSDEEIDLDDM